MLLSLIMSLASLITEIKQKQSRLAVVPKQVCRTVSVRVGDVGCRPRTAMCSEGSLGAGSSQSKQQYFNHDFTGTSSSF